MPLPNAPTAAATTGPDIRVYPSDLFSSVNTPRPNITTGGTDVTAVPSTVQTTLSVNNGQLSGGMYTQIQMVAPELVLTGAYGVVGSILSGGGLSSGVANPQAGSSIYLPLPWKINDIEMHIWNDLSFIDELPVINELAKWVQRGERALGTNLTVNPFAYMLYKQPAFREFELAWSFSPNNAAESQTLHQIINYLKTGALPEYATGGLSLNLPYLALVRLNPNRYMFDFKPCAVMSVNIDFTGSGQGPAFYNDGAPAIVNFTLGLKEVEIQVRSDTAWRGGALIPPGMSETMI